MEFLNNIITSFQANMSLYALVLVGLWALLWWSIENFRSLVQIIGSVLAPFFQPNENKTLVERFGKWAGKLQPNKIDDDLQLITVKTVKLFELFEL